MVVWNKNKGRIWGSFGVSLDVIGLPNEDPKLLGTKMDLPDGTISKLFLLFFLYLASVANGLNAGGSG